MQHQYILVKYKLKNRVLWKSAGNTSTFSSLELAITHDMKSQCTIEYPKDLRV